MLRMVVRGEHWRSFSYSLGDVFVNSSCLRAFWVIRNRFRGKAPYLKIAFLHLILLGNLPCSLTDRKRLRRVLEPSPLFSYLQYHCVPTSDQAGRHQEANSDVAQDFGFHTLTYNNRNCINYYSLVHALSGQPIFKALIHPAIAIEIEILELRQHHYL
jgi:hypothetical protein